MWPQKSGVTGLVIFELFHTFCVDRNLEQIVKAHQSKPQHGQSQLSDEAKFKVVSASSFSITLLESVGASCDFFPLSSVLCQSPCLHKVQSSPVVDDINPSL